MNDETIISDLKDASSLMSGIGGIAFIILKVIHLNLLFIANTALFITLGVYCMNYGWIWPQIGRIVGIWLCARILIYIMYSGSKHYFTDTFDALQKDMIRTMALSHLSVNPLHSPAEVYDFMENTVLPSIFPKKNK